MPISGYADGISGAHLDINKIKNNCSSGNYLKLNFALKRVAEGIGIVGGLKLYLHFIQPKKTG
jgi:hypothetical protein